MSAATPQIPAPRGWITRFLDLVERGGNKLPDPAVLFLLLMLAVWLVSALLSSVVFTEIDPRSGDPIQIKNLLAGTSFTTFMADMVRTFVNFTPLGVVLVAMLGLGVAEHTGFINAGLRAMLSVTPAMLLTPVLIAVGILSHVAVDAGYVLVIPLGAVIFYAAGRHPLAGIAAAFAGVSGGFSATFFLPSSLDPLLAGLTQEAARIIDRRGLVPDRPGDRATPAQHAGGRRPEPAADAGSAGGPRAQRRAVGGTGDAGGHDRAGGQRAARRFGLARAR